MEISLTYREFELNGYNIFEIIENFAEITVGTLNRIVREFFNFRHNINTYIYIYLHCTFQLLTDLLYYSSKQIINDILLYACN